MQIVNIENAEKLPLKLDAKLMYKGEKNEIILLSLAKGEILPKHDNPLAVTFFVLKGKGQISIKDKTYNVNEGDCFHVKPNNEREWKNTSDTDLNLLVIKELL